MLVEQLRAATSFLEAAEPFLLADEARNNLPLGIAATVRDYPTIYSEHGFWLVRDGGTVVGAALRTPPYNLVLAGPTSEEAVTALAASLSESAEALPGVTGAIPEVDHFVQAWCDGTGAGARRRLAQRVYRLVRLQPVSGVPGRPRAAGAADRDLLLEWIAAFSAEAVPEDTPGRNVARVVDARLVDGAGTFTMWEDDGPVSLAGWSGRTPNGARIGPVYTPPVHRGRGYGSAVTAAVTAERLAAGCSFCFLYTDLANPTSNHIYTAIGYEPVCDAIDYAFVPSATAA